MTSRATFGEFIRAAEQHLDQALAELATVRQPADADALIRDAATGLPRLVTVISRYARDFSPVPWQVPERDRPLMTSWGRAAIQSRESLEHFAAIPRPARSGPEPEAGDAEPGLFCRRLESAARALSIGHDLLGTHFATSIGGTRQGQSEWAPVIDSDPVSRALITEVLSLGAVTGYHCARLTWAGGSPDSASARKRLSAACHWLMTASTAVQSAAQADPVPDHAHELLHAIPVNAEPARPLRRGGETITQICGNAIDTAERARRASQALTRDAAWSPAMSGTSLRHAAAASAATSYHCELLLRSLAAQHDPDRDDHLRSQLFASAATASSASAAWLTAAHAWDQMTTDAPKAISRAAAAAADLAHWTGRLAFADPDWTVSRGPSQTQRPPQTLAATSDDVRNVIAAIHYGSETLTRLAEADFQQIKVVGQAGRMLVPTSSLDESYDIPHPIAPAPSYRIGATLAAYRDAATASRAATTAINQVAATVGAPSQLLTAARNAVTPDHVGAQHGSRSAEPPAMPPVRQAQHRCCDGTQPGPRATPEPGGRRRIHAVGRDDELDAGDAHDEALPRHEPSVGELGRSVACRRMSDVPTVSHARVEETILSPDASPCWEQELEP